MRSAKKPNILILIFGFACSGFGDVLMSGFRALSEQYPMAQNYSPFKYVTLIFKVIAVLLFVRKDCYDWSFKSQLREANATCQIFNRGSVLCSKSLIFLRWIS